MNCLDLSIYLMVLYIVSKCFINITFGIGSGASEYIIGEIYVSRIKKRFERIMNNPKDIKWNELRTVLESFSLICEPPGNGSHWTVYDSDSDTNLTVPVHNNRVKPVYVRKLIALISEVRGED